MAGLLAIAIVLLAAVQVHSNASREDVNDVRLDDLSDKLDHIGETLSEREGNRKTRLKELVELQGRVEALKGNSCGNRAFRCKTRSEFCIHDILVCDGKFDCPDESDEAHCGNPASAGTTLVGDAYNIKCSADAAPRSVRMDVIGEKRYNHFPSVVETTVRLAFTMVDDSVRVDTYEALYSFGQKKLMVMPKGHDGLAMVCTYRTDTSDFCHAEFASIVSKEVCGEAILTSE